jgi:hypothetical protein
MKRALAFTLLCFIGCDRGPPPRQIADPSVPAHTLRERFVGQWQHPARTMIVLTAHPEGAVQIEYPSPDWDNVINNVRWEGDRLCFDLYQYGKPKERIKGYDGTRSKVELSMTDEPDLLKEFVPTKVPGDGMFYEHKRVKR